jgi:hypothetical protein
MIRDGNVRCAHTSYLKYVRKWAWGNGEHIGDGSFFGTGVVTPSRPHKFMKFMNSQLWPREYRYEKAVGKKDCRLNLL